jgi:hemerythrin-like domain-containing protein
VNALPILADMIDTADRAEFTERFEQECLFITGQLVPHINAIENTLYGELERLMDRRHSMQPMREEHDQLRRLLGSLCLYRAELEAGALDDASAMGLRRVLSRLYSLLKVHLAEEERYLLVIDRDLSAAEKDTLARGIDHAAAEPI